KRCRAQIFRGGLVPSAAAREPGRHGPYLRPGGIAAAPAEKRRDQAHRLRDEVAASGGYMMACVAERIIAAPFAIIGSIGVVGQLPNFNRFLKEHNVDFELHTAGQYKRTLTLFGKNTDAARDKFQEELEDTHKLFKSFVTENRPQLEIEMVATGEHWYGTLALERKLIDIIQTSDDYLLAASKDRDIFEVHYKRRRPLQERLASGIRAMVKGVSGERWQDRMLPWLFRPILAPHRYPAMASFGPDLDLPGLAANLAVLHQAAFHVGLQEEFNGFTAIGAGDLEAIFHVL